MTFILLLMIPGNPARAVAVIMMRGRGPHVLVVDADPWARYALARLFQSRDIGVRTASSVGEGLSLLETMPACIVLDIDLPDGEGEEIFRAVRERGLDARVVICTAGVAPQRMQEVRRLKPDAFFLKPVGADELVGACCL